MPSPGSMPASNRRPPARWRRRSRWARVSVCERVCSEKSLNFTFTVTVRVALDCPPQHRGHGLGHAQDVALELGRIDQVLAESLLVPDRLVGAVRVDGIRVLAPGQRGQMGAAGPPETPGDGVGRQGGEVPHGADAQVV